MFFTAPNYEREQIAEYYLSVVGLGDSMHQRGDLTLDRRTRMMYDSWHVFINGESFCAAGRDAKLMRRLADGRRLTALEARGLSADANELVAQWAQAGWLHVSAARS